MLVNMFLLFVNEVYAVSGCRRPFAIVCSTLAISLTYKELTSFTLFKTLISGTQLKWLKSFRILKLMRLATSEGKLPQQYVTLCVHTFLWNSEITKANS
jgi:hypothetical protein